MSKTPPNLADLPPDVQAFVAAQAAELARKDAEVLELSISHASAQKRLKDERWSKHIPKQIIAPPWNWIPSTRRD